MAVSIGAINNLPNVVQKLRWGFSGPHTSPPIVADIELISSVAGVVIRVESNPTGAPKIAIVAADDKNVFPWLRRGEERFGRARRALTAFFTRCVRSGIEAIPFYV